jgi:tetratricopeptide (TPR) repeat protein
VNYADILRHNGDYREANREFGEVLKLEPDSAIAKFAMGMIHLSFGDLAKGWELYESRFDVETFPTKRLKSDRPIWDGEDLAGKTILVWEEQGFGDSFHFCRYFKELKRRGAQVFFRGNILYRKIAQGMIGLDEFFAIEDSMPDFDYHCAILSLPRKTGIMLEPAPTPYLVAAPSWSPYVISERVRIDHPERKKVGLCWAGSPRHGKDAFRSIAPEAYQGLIDAHPDINFFSLQVGPRAGECQQIARITDLAPTILDFADTAQAILQLDLVISVDTAVVHLAGALGRPCWMLCPFSPDWRWQLSGEDSPWYPLLRLFRQEQPGDWEPALNRINEALGEWKK